MRVAFSPVYHYQLPPKHRFPMAKYDLLPEQLMYEGTLVKEDFFHPELLPLDDLFLTHLPDYYQRLTEGRLTRKEEKAIGFPLSLKLITRGRHIAQGTLDCARYAKQEGVALNIAGGTHHSYADRGEGFCVFNDIAIAINKLISTGEIRTAMVVDLDVHQGNGTAKLFENKPNVFTLSFHGERNYPLRKEKSDLDVGFADKTQDTEYLTKLDEVLPSLLDQFAPDIVFYLSGVDVLEADKLGRLSLSIEGCKQRDQFVLSACKQRSIPVAVSMGGGYAERLATIIEAHANTFRVAKSLFE